MALNLKDATQELLKALRGRSRTSFLPSAREVTDSVQNAPPAALADVLVTHLNISLEGEMTSLLGDSREFGWVGSAWLDGIFIQSYRKAGGVGGAPVGTASDENIGAD